ncbi:polysaccharide biosynthesis protein [Microbacterium sp. No. 7]|uniref:polysaccharide biosynthesis protein n=1 Tax=Microbacterium sp. No. 7 TaxID=1714373 RepID=UPI0006ECE400|nr:nucleoside-diphosphate sugar epimerase/dehydratase [Microbacterium sp. No. 7]ALJ19097.1 capsule biosynthesis protein CapD [Microbacterium sp. No. 7]
MNQQTASSAPRARHGVQFATDALAWALSLVAAEALRHEFDLARVAWAPLAVVIVAAVLVQLAAGWATHLYRGRYTDGSFEEVRALMGAVGLTTALVAVPLLVLPASLHVSRSVVLIAAPIAFVLMLATRYVRRLAWERDRRPTTSATPVVIFGAGDAGSRLVKALAGDAESPFRIVGMLDDDPARRNAQVRSVRVLGTLDDLPQVVADTDAEAVIVAIGQATAELMRRVHDVAGEAGVRVKVMPPFGEILSNKNRVADLRDISIEDLIGRQPVDTNVESIAGYVTGRRVLVTGAGGSIGSELCRQLARFGPSELIMLDRDETGLQQTQIGTFGHGLLNTRDVVLADIRDADALQRIFADRRPEVVFHAAALKHLPMLEQYPDEAWKTNVLGTLNVLQAARAVGVGTFVNISTDKAANPASVLGHSKRAAERLTAWVAENEPGKRYLSVRFGNVIGSRGSMLPTFRALIEAGRPVTVTHPDVTRYFMTIPEACQLVVQAGGIGRGGEVLILDMGEPVRILDVARRMIELSGKDVDIVFTGLREGEKMHEELVGRTEHLERPFHPKISHARVEAASPDQLDRADW